MTERLVVGIFPESDPKAIEVALSAQQVDLSKVKVVSANAIDFESSQLDFVDVVSGMNSNSLSDDMTRGTGVLSDSGGTAVPGISSPPTTLGAFDTSAEEPAHYLAGYAVPDDEVDNFDEAIADGRAVILYPDPSDEEAVAAAFKAAGLRNVRAY